MTLRNNELTQDEKAALSGLVVDLRAFLRDYGALNRIVEGKESSDRDLGRAILLALDDYNTTPPLIDNSTVITFPSKSLLIGGATIFVLSSVGLLQTRNKFTFNDGNITIAADAKAPELQSWISIFQNQYERLKLRLKTAKNIEAALASGTSNPSEYALFDVDYLSDDRNDD